MYSRDVMGEKREKMSFFSVVTEMSTHGDTLKHRAWTFVNNFSDTKVHVDSDYIAQIVKHDVNKGHIVDYRKISYKKIDIFFTKKFMKNFLMFFRLFS